ncbi:MAG: thioredoxin family protein [Patescibacteria group bacterium]|nr:MAG: thioredoxin family protein [Patescibacteria group bacterium]
MKIQVLGSGCSTCEGLYEMVKTAAKELGIKEEVEYLTGDKGIQKIMEFGIMQSPVLVINDKPVMVGFTTDISEIKKIIQESIKS